MNAVVIGCGIAALMSARRLSENGDINVDILFSGMGASPYVHGFNIPVFEDDTVDVFISDTLKSGYYLNNTKLVDVLCNNSLGLIDFLQQQNIDLNQTEGKYELLQPLGSTYPRVVSSGNHTGVRIIQSLTEELKKRDNVHFCNDTRALRIIQHDDCVTGVLTYDNKNSQYKVIDSQCVVLASGGFCGIFPFSTNSKDISGDGIAMAYLAGAELVDMEFIQYEPCVAISPKEIFGKSVITTMFYEGAVLRNGNRDRFMLKDTPEGEKVNKDILSKEMYKEIKSGSSTPKGGIYFDATAVDKDLLATRYKAYKQRYEEVNIDISKQMVEVAPGAHTSLGGVVIDEKCQTTIKGVFAAGEIIGGLHGANRIGGNAGLEILVFGDIAGRSAREYLKNCSGKKAYTGKYIPYYEKNMSIDEINGIRLEMQNILSETFPVVRSGEDMKKAIEELEVLREKVGKAKVSCKVKGDQTSTYQRIRLENDLLCSYLLATSAYSRGESVGCHVRLDSSKKDYNYNILLKKDQNQPVIYKDYKCNSQV